jgi:hypothetical protein
MTLGASKATMADQLPGDWRTCEQSDATSARPIVAATLSTFAC